MKILKTSGKRYSTYLETQARRLNDAAGQARQESVVELPADGAALDTAYDVCRYCFNEFQRTANDFYKDRESWSKRYFFDYAIEKRSNAIKMFFDLLSAYLGIDKDC